MTKQTIEIKRLLHDCNIDMGTFGLIELELIEMEKQIQTTVAPCYKCRYNGNRGICLDCALFTCFEEKE